MSTGSRNSRRSRGEGKGIEGGAGAYLSEGRGTEVGRREGEGLTSPRLRWTDAFISGPEMVGESSCHSAAPPSLL